MYTVDVQSAADAFLPSSLKVQVVLALLILSVLLVVRHGSSKDHPSAQTPVYLPGSHLTVAPFLRRRFGFLNDGFRKIGEKLFRFNMLRETVIVVFGESARKAFFANKAFDLTEGPKILSGAISMIKGVISDLQTRRIVLIHKRLASVQTDDHLRQLIVCIVDDCYRVMDTWGTSGTFDPFEKIYQLVFQTTVRSITCQEIADDPAWVARLKNLCDISDSGTTPTTIPLPWLPAPSILKKLLAIKEVYDIVSRAVGARVKSGKIQDDTLQILIDAQHERLVTVGFIMGVLVAGGRATGTTASWLIAFLSNNLEWKGKVIREIEELLSACCPAAAASTSLSSRLASIPFGAWKAETTVLDTLIHETSRIAQPHIAMRPNLGPDTINDSKTTPSGEYVVCPFSDVHLNPELYPDRWKFDLSRKEAKTPFGYVGQEGGNECVSMDDIRSNFPHDLTGHVTKSGNFPFASGSYGNIYKGKLSMRGRSTHVAIKTYKMYLQHDEHLHRKTKRFRREIIVWLNLEHPNVLPLFGTIRDPDMHPYIPAMVCPWMENGALSTYLEQNKDLTTAKRLILVNDVAHSLRYLHSKNVIHGDLSGSNVLVHANGSADFGLSTLLTAIGGPTFATSRQAKGTVRWMAPELFYFDDSQPITIPTVQSDVYSFGSIMLQILTGNIPYHHLLRDEQVIVAILKGRRPDRFDQKLVTNDRLKFIERCWSMDPDEPRPSSDEIVEFMQKEVSESMAAEA